jgi:hypothetical protein
MNENFYLFEGLYSFCAEYWRPVVLLIHVYLFVYNNKEISLDGNKQKFLAE